MSGAYEAFHDGKRGEIGGSGGMLCGRSFYPSKTYRKGEE